MSCRWYNLDCAQQQDFYSLNQFLYQENTDTEDYDYGDLGRGKLKYIFMHNTMHVFVKPIPNMDGFSLWFSLYLFLLLADLK